MKALLIGLVVGLLFFLFLGEPAVAAATGVLAAAGYAELDGLRRRIQALEAGARAVALTAPAVGTIIPSSGTPSAPAPAPMAPAENAQLQPPENRAPAAQRAPKVPSMWDRWRHASSGELEAVVAGRLLPVVGGIALFLGGVFFLGLAFSRGWIGPEMRVAIGLGAGLALFALGGWLLRGPRQIVAHVLVAVGLGVFTLALFAATRLYGFFAPEFGVAAAMVVAAAAAALAVRYDAQLIAAFGLVAVLAAPPVMGASATLLTMLFIGAAMAGATAVALSRSWRWLPSLAFVLAAPQLTSYILGDPPLGIGLAAIGGFWVLSALSAAGEELIARRSRLYASSATLLLAAAALVVALGFALLDGDLERWRGLYLLVVAAAHLAMAAMFLVREGDRHPFGMLAAGTGIAAVTMAVPIQLGAAWVPLAWASEAVALTWIYAERQHRFAGFAALVLGVLTAGHLVTVEYPLWAVAAPAADAVPFVNASGLALGFVVLAAAIATLLLRARHERIAVTAVAAGLVTVAIPHELVGIAEALALTAIGVGSLVAQRAALGIPLRPPPGTTIIAYADRALYGAAAIAGLALGAVFFEALPVATFLSSLGSTAIPDGRPFLTESAAIGVIVAGGSLMVGVANAGRWLPAGVLTAAAVIAYLLPFEVGASLAVAGWAVLAVALAAGARYISGARYVSGALTIGSGVLAALTIVESLLVVAPPDQLWVSHATVDEAAILNGGVLAAVAVTAMLAGIAVLLPSGHRARRWAAYAAGPAAVYAASVMVVDLFQVQLGGEVAVEELQKQAQVALSVLWAVIGVVATVGGLRIGSAPLRLFGLGLLGVVTLKVFVIDLAALDIAYRVLSFVALGVLLLGAAYLYGRMDPNRTERLGDGRS
jgi:uncharacterized membrane protein